MITLREVKEKIHANTYSVRKGVFLVRREFYYRFGKTAKDFKDEVVAAFPDAQILDFSEVWKPFRGGSSVANSSHWYVKFTFEKEIKE